MKKSSFGKVILSGEHSAVYGEVAVAASVNLAIEAELLSAPKNILASKNHHDFVQNLFTIFQNQYHLVTDQFTVNLSGNLPIGSGLGSSAATAHAVFQALVNLFEIQINDDEMIQLIKESERFAHGHPSGVDAVTVVKKGVVRFQRDGEKLSYASLPAQQVQATSFFLIQSGRPVESTKEMIAKVSELAQTAKGQKLIQQMGVLSQQVVDAIKNKDVSFDWIPLNERYLEELGVVSEQAQNMIQHIEKIGGEAKVTGGGGYQKGSGMLLAYHADGEKLADFLKHQSWEYFSVQLGK